MKAKQFLQFAELSHRNSTASSTQVPSEQPEAIPQTEEDFSVENTKLQHESALDALLLAAGWSEVTAHNLWKNAI
jgi:hypothetical protein